MSQDPVVIASAARTPLGAFQDELSGLRGCEKTPAYCDRLQTPAAALRYVKSKVI
nr:hypothetical protein [Azotobacter chroococcum]